MSTKCQPILRRKVPRWARWHYEGITAMRKDYTEKLAEWVRQRESPRRDKNLVAFLAVREDIESALRAGFSARTIWLNLYEEGRVSFRYTAFTMFVKRHIGKTEVKMQLPEPVICIPTIVRPRATQTRQGSERSKSEQSEPVRGFVFNPIPRKEDLI